MIWIWWAVVGLSLAALAWHEVAEHHLFSRIFRRAVAPSPHHSMWDGLGRPRRVEIRAEMVLFAALAAAVAGIFPVPAAVVAAVLTLASSGWVLFGRHA